LYVLSKRVWRGGLAAAFLMLACAAWAVETELDEAHAVEALRKGGQIVYMRHTERFRGLPKDGLTRFSTPAEYSDCSRQRNLTPRGIAQAKALGADMRRLGVKVGRVIANIQCRTRDTAILAFGHAELDAGLFDLAHVEALLRQDPGGANIVLVGNDYQLKALTGVELDVGEMALIEPRAQGGFTVTARLELGDWEEAASPGWW
jgi:hypothetical protein